MDFGFPFGVPLKQATKGVPSKKQRQLEPWKSKNGSRQFWEATLPKSDTELVGGRGPCKWACVEMRIRFPRMHGSLCLFTEYNEAN